MTPLALPARQVSSGVGHGQTPLSRLSDQATRETLLLDPVRFLTTQPTPCVVDEAQPVPDLTVWVKRVVDDRRSPGQFLLTGSARLGRHQLGGSDPLAGRSVRLQMSSMTRAERSGQLDEPSAVDRAFGVQAPTVKAHLELLEASFLLIRLEAERPTEHRVVTAHPRVFATDVGLATWASRAWAADPPSAATVGALAETAVARPPRCGQAMRTA